MKRWFPGIESLILIFSLSMVCLVSQAKGMPYDQNNFNKKVLFLFSEHELTLNLRSQDRLVKPAFINVKQVYCNFLVKVFEKSEVKFSLIFIILISVWSYRRYEIIKIKKRNSIGSKNIKQDTDQIPDTFEINHFPRKVESINVFPADNFETRCCVYSSENKSLISEVDLNESVDRDILRILLANIRRDAFCKYVCIEKKKCYFPFAKHLVEEPFSSKMDDYDFYSDELNTIEGFPLAEGIKHKSLPPILTISPENKEFLTKVVSVLNSNYSDYRFSVDNLAGEVGMSLSQLNRKMNLIAGYPSGHLIRKFRLHKAADLLITSSSSVSEVCFATGFNDLSYFSRAFKGQFGFSPTSYKRQMTRKS